MAKLSKQEVNAVANKLRRELEKIYDSKKEKWIKNYVPSETYLKIGEFLDKYNDCRRQVEELNRLQTTYYNELIDLGGKYEPRIYPFGEKDNVLKEVIKAEFSSDFPSIEEIKEDITIAAIDSDFDVNSFIEKQLKKYE